MGGSTPEDPAGSEISRCSLRLLIVDNQPRVRKSLMALLAALVWRRQGGDLCVIEIVGNAYSGLQAVEQVERLRPDVVVLDLPMHVAVGRVESNVVDLNGKATIREIKSRWPAVRVVVLTMYATDRASAVDSGADAFLLKGCPAGELLGAITPAAPYTEQGCCVGR